MLKKSWESTKEFLLDVRAELRKVTFPTLRKPSGRRPSSSSLVMIVSLFLALTISFLVWLIGRII